MTLAIIASIIIFLLIFVLLLYFLAKFSSKSVILFKNAGHFLDIVTNKIRVPVTWILKRGDTETIFVIENVSIQYL